MSSKGEVRRRVMTPNPNTHTTDPLLQQRSADFRTRSCWQRIFVDHGKIKWYWAPVFLSFWVLLYFFISIPAYHRLPKPINIADEARYPDRFIAERAEQNLIKLIALGPRVVGSVANEQNAIQYFQEKLKDIQAGANPLLEIEGDVQLASGSYCHWDMVNMYQGIQNFVIKIGPKDTNSTSYLLVNSHFDSVPHGKGAGDDGTMVAIMLETARVISKSSQPLLNPVVFLFNGAEENPLQASHAFITQHKWAKYIKALINLDSAGNGGREILFQSGPNHPWLMKHYRRAVMHPYASTVAEEMFQRQFIPSDTDFRIFRDHGRVPGLDMAHQYNGYVYHTRFDVPDIVPRGTFQNTGDNVLALVREIANAPELEDPSLYSEGHTIFFDVLGHSLVFYSETEGVIVNVLVSLVAIITCTYSFKQMAHSTGTKFVKVVNRAITLFGIQVLAVSAAAALCFLMAVLLDLLHMPMTWFTNSWLIMGLYFCPLFFGFAIVPAIYFKSQGKDRFPLGYRVQILLHCHCLFLAFVTLIATIAGIRSAFMLMIAVLFYTLGLIVNLSTKLHNKSLPWLIPHIICNIPPFLFYAYQAHGFFVTFIPMTGRFGARVNPDLIICGFTIGVGILTGGFMIPVLNLFRKSKTIICSLLVFTALFLILAVTPIGFPYRPATNVQRFSVLHTRRVFHDETNAVRRLETGYFILPQDRRIYSVKNQLLNMSLAQTLDKDCEEEMLCGLPLYNHRWHKARASSIWIPGPDPQFDRVPQVKLISKDQLSKTSIRYKLELSGPDHMGLYINPLKDRKVSAWSFHYTPLRLGWDTPYFIYFSYGKDSSPLNFTLEFENPSEDWSSPIFEIGIAGHWNHDESTHTEDFKKFLSSFPKYVDAIAWPAYYETRLF
ncbi:endoplasmic reticulum metallopeptidase 1 isoform X1 [Anastrepha obliqua]|uniref:endoplasmic reticulum metallopeptidase 1 isoform X1 n=1 Tax=Anastrepha obliqua TaxID=95512 RepID=UPI00240A43CC|nr:endoplasmic reticulum metallopeptidase 1 isoform X1 [Anastrepha obliqua]